MELTESIESINNQLIDLFGIDTLNGLPIWRVSWAEDQIEKQYGTFNDFTSNGMFIRSVTEVREIKKYPWIKNKYILEQLTLVNECDQEQLAGAKIAYNCMFVFENKNGNYLPPQVQIAQFVIDTIYAAMGKTNLAKYKEAADTGERLKEVNELHEELFGNETTIGDALAYKTGIVVPGVNES